MPLPLAPEFWRGLLRGGEQLPDGQLALAILADRRSALLYRGLAGLDEETLAALAAEPDALRRIQRRHADVFAAFGSRFAVRGGSRARCRAAPRPRRSGWRSWARARARPRASC